MEIIAIYSENYTRPINTLCGQNAELLNVKMNGTHSCQCALQFQRQLSEQAAPSISYTARP
jgi:hypothetical protein